MPSFVDKVLSTETKVDKEGKKYTITTILIRSTRELYHGEEAEMPHIRVKEGDQIIVWFDDGWAKPKFKKYAQ